MPSDRSSGAPEPLARLAEVLTEATGGTRPTPLELAELLWLAGQMEQVPETPAPAPEPPVLDERPPHLSEEPSPPPPPQQRDSAPAPTPEPDRVPLHLPAPTPGRAMERHAAFLAPAPPMLRHPLTLQRSLRPLKRRTDAPLRQELDERATAERIARLAAPPEWWLPVMRPARERWLRLNLIHDAGPTMPVWRPLVHELHTALAQSGIFRMVSLHRADPDGRVHPDTPTPADGRTVTLLISDCMGPQWRKGEAGTLWYDRLHRWARRMPLAVVQPLPEYLWQHSALPTAPGRLSAPHPAAPTAALTFSPYDTTVRYESAGTVPLPVLESDPEWLANWALLIASPGGTDVPASAAPLTGPLPTDVGDRTDVRRLSAEELVLRFRATASPEAFRLAGHLALGHPHLPIMRLVHAALEPRPRPQHLAEVILSGMLRAVPGPAGCYAFRPGVRELLLRSLPRTARGRTAELLERVGGLIEERAGAAPGEFRAAAPAPGGTQVAVDGEAFATVSPQSLLQMSVEGWASGLVPESLRRRYRLLGMLSRAGMLWRAHDTEQDRTVALLLYERVTYPARREAFLRDTGRLRELGHQGMVTIHDYGIEDDVPYVVMEYLDGIALNALASPGGDRLPVPLLMSLGRQLANVLTALHATGAAHGGLGMRRVVLLPDGTAKITPGALGRSPVQQGEAGASADLLMLGALLFHLASGHAFQPGADLSPDRYTGLPIQVRRPFALAVGDLLARDNPGVQQRGLRRLQDATLLSPLTQTAHERLHYTLLGPPAVERSGRPLAIGSPREQAMLCMLLLRHGRRVTRTELTEGIWGRKPPARADALLGTYASRLRDALGPGVLATLPDGYAIHTSADFVDVIQCQLLVDQADLDNAGGRIGAARMWVNDALSLWRSDSALEDVPGPAAAAARSRLDRLRLGLHRTLAELDLDLGEFERAEAALDRLVQDHPSREDFLRLYLIALQRQGRTAEALEVYEEYRLSGGTNPELLLLGRELREELGETPDVAPEPGYEMGEDPGTGFGLAPPDEMPEGVIPTDDLPSLLYPWEESPEDRTPLPQDEVPESLFAAEDAPTLPTTRSRPDVYQVVASYRLADGPRDPDAVPALGRAVTRVLAVGGLEDPEYDLLIHEDGCTVVVESGDRARSLLWATLHDFQDLLVKSSGVRLLIGFSCAWEGGAERPDRALLRRALDDTEARGVIGLAPSLRDELGDRPDGAPRLQRLSADPEDGWYRLGLLPREFYDGTQPLPPVLGPYRLTATQPLPEPHGTTKDVVFTLPDGAFSLTRTPEAESYYEIDLTPRHAAYEVPLPSSGAGTFTASVELSWHVDDPASFARSYTTDIAERLLGHLLVEAERITRRHPLGRAGAAQNAIRDALRHWQEPGLWVTCSVRLTPVSRPGPTPRQSPYAPDPLTDLLRSTETVLVGFEGPLTQLFSSKTARSAALDLLSLIVEDRDPEDALAGRPVTGDDGPMPGGKEAVHPLRVLRAFARRPVGPHLRTRLDQLELQAAAKAMPTPHVAPLLYALHAAGRRVVVVTDCSPEAVHRFLERHRLPVNNVHGRKEHLERLMPHPDCLLRALRSPSAPARVGLVISSSTAELEAAAAIGLHRVAYAPTPSVAHDLRDTDCDLTFTSLEPLLEAARSL